MGLLTRLIITLVVVRVPRATGPDRPGAQPPGRDGSYWLSPRGSLVTRCVNNAMRYY